MSRLALVDQLLEERYGKGLADEERFTRHADSVVTPIAKYAPPVRAHGPAAICHTRDCRTLSAFLIEVPFRGRRRACGLHVDDALDHLGITGTADIRITRIAP